MRTSKISFQVFAAFLLGSILSCTAMKGATTTSVNASAGANSCVQTGGMEANCAVSTPAGVNGPETASGSAIANLFSGGRLEATASAKGPFSTATASVDFSAQIYASGASGSGELIARFVALNESFNQVPATAMVSLITVTVGGTSVTALPADTNEVFATVPIEFGTLLPFDILFSVTATGTQFHDGTFGAATADEILPEIPGLSVYNPEGIYIPGAHVEFTPEPGTLGLLGCAAGLLMLLRRRFV